MAKQRDGWLSRGVENIAVHVSTNKGMSRPESKLIAEFFEEGQGPTKNTVHTEFFFYTLSIWTKEAKIKRTTPTPPPKTAKSVGRHLLILSYRRLKPIPFQINNENVIYIFVFSLSEDEVTAQHSLLRLLSLVPLTLNVSQISVPGVLKKMPKSSPKLADLLPSF